MKVLGIDYGRSKIGLALGDTETGLVEPLRTISNLQFTIYNLQTIINEENIEKIVIGVSGGRMETEVKDFGKKLGKETKLPVEFFDETLTTYDAQRILIEGGQRRKFRKAKEDAVAAALVLQLFLERRQS